MTPRLVSAALLATACASTPRAVTVGAVATPPTPPAGCAGLEPELLRLRGDTAALRVVGMTLHHVAGERTITGEAAADETLSRFERVACVADSAAAVARTSCGNATLVGFSWRVGAWAPTSALPLVEAGRPGRCVESVAVVTPVALTSTEPRELAVETEASSDDGAESSGRSLRVAYLGERGVIRWYAGTVDLGSFNDVTGVATQGRWDIIEALPLPRDLYVEQRPLHGGLGGEPIGREIRRETWRVRGFTLERIDVTRERVIQPAPSPVRLP